MSLRNGKFRSGPEHPRWGNDDERLALLRTLDTGSLSISGHRIERCARSRQSIEMVCSSCGIRRLISVDNILTRKTKTCRCHRAVKYHHPQAKLIAARYDAAKSRCANPHDAAFPNYGGRGIRMRFPNRRTYTQYILDHLPCQDYSVVDVDRINNDGDYEPGNLRLASRSVNLRNKNTNVSYDYKGKKIICADLHAVLKRDFPDFRLSSGTTAKLAAKGTPVESILQRSSRSHRPKVVR